ncbi:glutathione S-transferase 1 [Ditylenchus destructor]|nr:glutathione S-transferase 1 [Ditylenchus destructor]
MTGANNHTYKLSYFGDVRALGEPIRLLFHYVGQPFEDDRVDRIEWHKDRKAKSPFGKVPILEVDGGKLILAQSNAIARFIAEKHGLAGKDEVERARVDELQDSYKDLFSAVIKYLAVKFGFRPGDVDALHKDEYAPALDFFLPIWNKILQESKSGFLVNSGVTFVDFFLADFLYTFQGLEPELMAKFDQFDKYVKKVYDLPRVKDHVEKREHNDI